MIYIKWISKYNNSFIIHNFIQISYLQYCSSPDFQQYDGDKISGAPFRQNSINVTNRIRDNSKNNFDHMRINSERKLHSENLEEFRRNNFRLNERLPHKFSLDLASENQRNVLERRRSTPRN